MTKNLKPRSIAAVPDAHAADLKDSHPAAGSPRELAARVQRIGDDLAVLRRDLLSLGDRPTERPGVSTQEPTLLTVEAAGGYLVVSRTVVYALIKSGALDRCRSARRAECRGPYVTPTSQN